MKWSEPHWRTHIFQRGRSTTNQYLYIYIYNYVWMYVWCSVARPPGGWSCFFSELFRPAPRLPIHTLFAPFRNPKTCVLYTTSYVLYILYNHLYIIHTYILCTIYYLLYTIYVFGPPNPTAGHTPQGEYWHIHRGRGPIPRGGQQHGTRYHILYIYDYVCNHIYIHTYVYVHIVCAWDLSILSWQLRGWPTSERPRQKSWTEYGNPPTMTWHPISSLVHKKLMEGTICRNPPIFDGFPLTSPMIRFPAIKYIRYHILIWKWSSWWLDSSCRIYIYI